ncbi:MAG: bifunctional adenosylcobinamide kinase/adenosylcobinamide-phosphate guanylyltransferase [Nitrospirae bacterium]|nr:bifunctional adenosylcobinamide kinase/adenosylcobinamide-phosphate guanylyltransferase [Nitrospirota bacterium]
MGKIVLITGGARSGKSDYALELADAYKMKAFIATAEPVDEEMRRRIETHRRERDSSFLTIEEPIRIAKALLDLPKEIEVSVIDCLTVWLGNLMHRFGEEVGDHAEIISFQRAIRKPRHDLIIVTNEVGMGIVPPNAAARQFRDLAGRLNRQVADMAGRVILMVCGMPITVKEQPRGSS